MWSRILWCSPLPPQRSGVAGYAAELLPEMVKRAELEVVLPPDILPAELTGMPAGIPLRPFDSPPGSAELQLLHLGNNPFHIWIFDRARRRPSVVVLHDVVLHHLLVESTVAEGRDDDFEALMCGAHGNRGYRLAHSRRFGLAGPWDPFLYPATLAGVEGAQAVVVHSRWAAGQVRAAVPGTAVCQCPLPVADPGAVDRVELRRGLGLPDDALVLMHLGFLTEQKGLPVVLAAVAAAVDAGLPVHLVLLGDGGELSTLERAVRACGLAARVHATGWVDDERMMRLPAAADLGVALRTPSAGETSAAVLRFLACGTPVAVNGNRQYLEWPRDVAPRVTPGPGAAAELARVVMEVARQLQDGSWQLRRDAARASYLGSHTPDRAARALCDFLTTIG